MITLAKRSQNAGYTTIGVVVLIAIVSLAFMNALFERAVSGQSGATESSVRQDSRQREDAFLDALIAIVPEKAIQTMQSDSWANEELQWHSIFREALERANVYGMLDVEMMEQMGVTGIVANPSDLVINSYATEFSKYIKPVAEDMNSYYFLSPGVNRELTGKFPPPLSYLGSSSRTQVDSRYPVISKSKQWGSASEGYVSLPTDLYPEMNLFPYPDLLFNYVESGSEIIGKRNWWAFRINFSGDYSADAEFQTYVLSLYELPMQLPINTANFTALGTHLDGADWVNVDIEGSVYAKKVYMEGQQQFDRVASQQDNDIFNYRGQIDGVSLAEEENYTTLFQAQGAREIYLAENGTGVPVSAGQDSGRVALVSINRGLDFYDLYRAESYSDVLSETTWDDYSHGASQCAMRVVVTETISPDNQTPVAIDFSYYRNGVRETRQYETGVNWPSSSSADGGEFPFHPYSTDVGKNTLAVYLERIQPFLDSLGADDATVNNSLLVQMDYRKGVNVQEPVFPTTTTDMGVVLLEGEDLSVYERGFSLVTHTTLYIADDLNFIATTPPAGSTVPTPYYPPLSLYAPESRFGVSVEPRLVEISGQMGNLSKDDSELTNILDFKSGATEAVVAQNITADLYKITHPDQLPPVYTMNWLLTIERVE